MEGILLLLVIIFYVFLRIAFSFRPNPIKKDKRKFAIGLQMLHNREYTEAILFFDDALAQAPKSVIALLARAQCHLHTHEYVFALADAVRATTQDDHLPEAYMIKGKALYKMGNFAHALVEFNKAAWYDRDNAEPICWRGLTHHRLGQPQLATAALHQAKAMGDENAAFYLLQQDNIPSWV